MCSLCWNSLCTQVHQLNTLTARQNSMHFYNTFSDSTKTFSNTFSWHLFKSNKILSKYQPNFQIRYARGDKSHTLTTTSFTLKPFTFKIFRGKTRLIKHEPGAYIMGCTAVVTWDSTLIWRISVLQIKRVFCKMAAICFRPQFINLWWLTMQERELPLTYGSIDLQDQINQGNTIGPTSFYYRQFRSENSTN